MWEYKGVRGAGDCPSYVGQYHGRLVVLAGGRHVWAEYDRIRGLSHQVMAVNDIGMYFPGTLEHWTSEHAQHLRHWIELRRAHSLMGHECLTHTNKPTQGSTYGIRVSWDLQPCAPFSGLFAAQLGLVLGYDRIMLCGCPQDGSGHFYDPPWLGPMEHGDKSQLKAFRYMVEQNPEFSRVSSMSGWTKELLGDSWD